MLEVMRLKTPEQRNKYRDARYFCIFQDIQVARKLLEQPPTNHKKYAWESELAASIDDLAEGNGYRVYRKNSTMPDLFFIGYEHLSKRETASFLQSLALKEMFRECAFLMEGYQEGVTNLHFDHIFREYKIKPQGIDSFSLLDFQYKKLREIEALQKSMDDPSQSLSTNKTKMNEKVLEAIDCLVKRERDYFVPAILEQKEKGKPVIFLASMTHALSTNLPIVLNNNGIRYALFVQKS